MALVVIIDFECLLQITCEYSMGEGFQDYS